MRLSSAVLRSFWAPLDPYFCIDSSLPGVAGADALLPGLSLSLSPVIVVKFLSSVPK
jgi:hypothetical protein